MKSIMTPAPTPDECAPDAIIGVRTTRIYCRPGCPSRPPLPRDVVRFASARAARDAGFRACKRCRPDEASPDADARLVSATTAVVRYLAGDGPWPDLPLDVRATAFQTRVWNALRAIAPGATTTYSELARALGDERATRAVARACAADPIALLVPCHRVVRKAGGFGGYRWGIERKRTLLALERERAERGA